MPLRQGVDNHPLVWYPSAPRPQCLHFPPDHTQLLSCPSAMTSCRLSYQMIESTYRIDDTHTVDGSTCNWLSAFMTVTVGSTGNNIDFRRCNEGS